MDSLVVQVRELLAGLQETDGCPELETAFRQAGRHGTTPLELARQAHLLRRGTPAQLYEAVRSAISSLLLFARQRVAEGDTELEGALQAYEAALMEGPVHELLLEVAYSAELLGKSDYESPDVQAALLEAALHPSGATEDAWQGSLRIHSLSEAAGSQSLPQLLSDCRGGGVTLRAFHSRLYAAVGVLLVAVEQDAEAAELVMPLLMPLQHALRVMRAGIDRGEGGRQGGANYAMRYVEAKAKAGRESRPATQAPPQRRDYAATPSLLRRAAQAQFAGMHPPRDAPSRVRAAGRKRAAETPAFRPVLPEAGGSPSLRLASAALGITGLQCSLAEERLARLYST